MAEQTVDGLRQEILDARNQWEKSIAGLRNADFEANITAAWTLKDVYVHLVTYLELDVKHLQAYKKRKKLASMRARNYYQFNQREAARSKRVPLTEVRRRFDAAYDQLLMDLATLTDADLKMSFASPWSTNDTRRVRLATVLRADVSNHLLEHARAVELWRRDQNR